MRAASGARAPPTNSVRTMVIMTIELAVSSARLGSSDGMAAASAGLKSWPNELNRNVIRRRWRTSPRMGGQRATIGISATAAPRPTLAQTMMFLRLWRSAETPAEGGGERDGHGEGGSGVGELLLAPATF